MAVNSCRKGKVGERDAAAAINAALGLAARRGQQRSGVDEQDLIDHIEGTHCEVKRTERLSLYTAIEQAARDAGDKIPWLLHRRNRKPWLVVVRLDDLKSLVKAIHEAQWTDFCDKEFAAHAPQEADRGRE